jgi:hypothetical protein
MTPPSANYPIPLVEPVGFEPTAYALRRDSDVLPRVYVRVTTRYRLAWTRVDSTH